MIWIYKKMFFFNKTNLLLPVFIYVVLSITKPKIL